MYYLILFGIIIIILFPACLSFPLVSLFLSFIFCQVIYCMFWNSQCYFKYDMFSLFHVNSGISQNVRFVKVLESHLSTFCKIQLTHSFFFLFYSWVNNSFNLSPLRWRWHGKKRTGRILAWRRSSSPQKHETFHVRIISTFGNLAEKRTKKMWRPESVGSLVRSRVSIINYSEQCQTSVVHVKIWWSLICVRSVSIHLKLKTCVLLPSGGRRLHTAGQTQAIELVWKRTLVFKIITQHK